MRLKIIKFKKKKKPGSSLFEIIVGYKYKQKSKNFFFEKIGYLNFKHPKLLGINIMRLGYWLNHGAVLNKTIKKYLIKLCYKKKNTLII
jgi:hypothetical protein